MNDNQKKLIIRAIDYIEENIKEPIDLTTISNDTGMSKAHLHRLFKALTGQPMISYIRQRKLAQSLHELLETDMSVLDIAYEYAFEYEQSYIRAFRKNYKTTPAQFRKSRKELTIMPKAEISSAVSIGQGLLLNPNIVIKPEFKVQGYRSTIIHSENLLEKTTNKQVEEYENKYLGLISNPINSDIYIGLVLYSDKQWYCNDYVTCTEVKDNCSKRDHLTIIKIPHSEYAVFKYIGFHGARDITYEALLELYQNIFSTWMQKKIYQGESNYHFERLDLQLCSSTYCEMDIYIPLGSKYVICKD